MNTKYPINGRYTTLGDIIHEYGRYSALPDDKLEYWNHKITAPFVHFIYNDFPTDSQNAIRPYDIVWFDNVYSETEKENTGKRMKLIQSQDSSTYSFDRPITAKEVKIRSEIQKGAFEFRFIIPSTTSTDGKDRFYYNYKTASGESVVMYALRTIIDEAKKNITDPAEKLKTFFIGDTDSNGFRTIQPSTEHIFTYRYKITDNNSSIIEGNGQYNESVSGNNSYALQSIASKFDHKITYNNNTFSFVCPETADTSTQTKTITDNDGTYTIEVKYLTWQGIDLPYEDTSVNDSKIKSQERSGFPLFNFKDLPDNIFNSATELNNKAYQYLGDYYWTYKYVQLSNYASQSATDFEYNSCITEPSSCYEKIIGSIGAQTKPSPEKLCSILFDPTNYSQIKDTKNAENQYYKCLYFLLLFLNSQRFFVSYITAFEYINISNKSYAQREPVLRCDLNLIKPIERIKILSAQHFRETILPAGPLKPDTLISIIVYMKVKYKSIPNEKDFSTKINLTFEDLWNNKNITDTPDEEGIIGPWVTLINPFDHNWTEETKGVLTQTDDEAMIKYEGDLYGNDHFLQVNNNKLIDSYSDCSLGTLMWPKGVQLQLATADDLEIMRDNTSDEEWFASISDSSTYPDKYTKWEDFKEEKLSPFGYLRLHNYADINQKKESQFTVTVPLLRCNNWYYKQGASTSIDSAMIYSYFNNIYLNAQIAEPEPAIGMYVNTYAYGKQESNLQNIIDKLNQLPIAAPSRIAQETISQIFGLKIGQAETLFFASGAKMIDEKTTADEKYYSSYTLYFEKLLSSKVWQRINPVSGAPENNCIISRNADDKVVEQYEVSNDYRGQKGTYTLGRVYIDVDDTLLHNPKDNTKCFYFKITNADHNNEGKIQVSFLVYKDSDSKASSGELKLGFTQSITASFVIYNYNKPDTLDNIGTDKPSNTLTINNSVKQDTKTTDITIINDEHNKFIMSELSTTETYRLTKHHDNNDKEYLLHLFHYGVNSNNKLTVVFNNPKYMFRYQYPAIIDDTTKIISNAYSISLGDKFVTTTMSLTTDRTLYMALNPIYAFLHVNESTEQKLSGEDDKDCPPFAFQQSGIGYTQTNGQTTSCLISTQTPGCVISLVTDNVYITTDNIITGVNDNNGSLSDYIKSQRERKQLLEIKINKYEFDENDQVDLEGTQPNSTNIINTNTQPEFQIFTITKDTLTIFTYEVTKYRKDTSKDTFYVSLATAGWKGKSSNIKIYCVQEPPIDGNSGKELGNPNNIQPSDDILQEITKMGQQFKNDTSVWICVPQQTLDLSSENTTNICKHTQWDVDGKILSAQADGKISQTICISNKSITGVYLSYRTVYAIFETTESVTIPVQPEDTTITVSLTASPKTIEAKGGNFTLSYFVKKGNNPISGYGEPKPDNPNFAVSTGIKENINGQTEQTYEVGSNDLETPITCTYTLKYEGKEGKTTITQKGSVYGVSITAKTTIDPSGENIDPSGENIIITYYGIKNGDPISEGVKLTCSDNSITTDGQLTDNKLVSTIKIPSNTTGAQKTYTFTVTYTYLTDKQQVKSLELTQDYVEYAVQCYLDTEKYSVPLPAKPASDKDIFEIIYFAEKGTDKIYNDDVTLEPIKNYSYLEHIGEDTQVKEKQYKVAKFKFTENEEEESRDMEFKAKCGSNESGTLTIKQAGAIYDVSITAKTTIDPSGENIGITYYGIKNGDYITNTKDVQLTCSDNSITTTDDVKQIDNKLVSTIKIPENASSEQKTYTFTVTYTYLTDKQQVKSLELTQDFVKYVVHCGLDTEKYSATLEAKPESGKDIFEIIYFAEKGTDKKRIYDNTVKLEPIGNYDYLTLISDVPNPEKQYKVAKFKFTENVEADSRDMEFKAKCGSNESDTLIITQVGANMEVIPQFNFAIINYKIQNRFEMKDPFDSFTYKNKDDVSTLLSDTNGINAIAGSDLDVWVTFSLDDNESKDILLPVKTAQDNVIHLNLYGALNSSTYTPNQYILGAGFSPTIKPCINNDNNKQVYISTPSKYSTDKNENGNVCKDYIRYAADNRGGNGYESIFVNVANILNVNYQDKTLLAHKCKNLYIDLWGVMYKRRSTGKVSIDFNMYNFKENVTDPNLTVKDYTYIPDETKVDSVKKLNINNGFATGYSNGSHDSPTLISRITYPIRDGNPSIETKNLTYGNLNYCLLIPAATHMKYVTSLVYDTIYYDNISNIKPYELDLRTIYYQDYTLKNGDPNKKVLNPYKKLTGHNFTLTNPSYNVKKDGVSIVMDISNNVKLENNKFTLNFPKLTEEASYEFTIYGITEPIVLTKASGLNDIKSYSIIVELAKKR